MQAISFIIVILIGVVDLDKECILAFKHPIQDYKSSKFHISVGHIPIPEQLGEKVDWKYIRDTKRYHRYNLKAKGVNIMSPNLTKVHLRKLPSKIELLESILSLL